MTNWDEINQKKRKEITLGQAMNQAKDMLILAKQGYTEDDWKDLKNAGIDQEKLYKDWVKQFFEWNTELQEELL